VRGVRGVRYDRGVDGWILYDAQCGVCGRWVPRWAPALSRVGIGVAPLQDPAMRARTGLDEAALLEDVTLAFADGRFLRGADVYRALLARLWWASWVARLASLPGARHLFDAVYRTLARHRYAVSHACRLDPPLSPRREGAHRPQG
jgi:predicted DCC family thiol-disulfide oxidoreductase YuxK